MKYRLGFVSNSSAASFCIFGWQTSKLAEEQIESLREANKQLFYVEDPDEGEILGVGNSYCEIDHNCSDDEDWHDYETPPPSKEAQDELIKLAQKLGVPRPIMFSATFWD